MISYVS